MAAGGRLERERVVRAVILVEAIEVELEDAVGVRLVPATLLEVFSIDLDGSVVPVTEGLFFLLFGSAGLYVRGSLR